MANATYLIGVRRREAQQAEQARLNTGLYTNSASPEITQQLTAQRDLSRERAKQNAFLKALRLGKFGQRSLLSGSFAGITDENAALASLGGTRPGASVAAAAAPAGGRSSGIGGGGSSGSRGSAARRIRSVVA